MPFICVLAPSRAGEIEGRASCNTLLPKGNPENTKLQTLSLSKNIKGTLNIINIYIILSLFGNKKEK